MRAKAKLLILTLGAVLALAVAACGQESAPSALSTDPGAADAEAVIAVDGDHAEEGIGHGVESAVAIDTPDEVKADHGNELGASDDAHAESEMAMSMPDMEPADGEAHAHAASVVDEDAPVVDVIAREFKYETDMVRFKAGESFSIYLRNEGVLEHDITFAGLEEQGGIHVQPGEDGIATFTLDEPGEYVYYCTVPGHRDAGMHGTLTIIGAATVSAEDAGDEHPETGDTSDADGGEPGHAHETEDRHDEGAAGA